MQWKLVAENPTFVLDQFYWEYTADWSHLEHALSAAIKHAIHFVWWISFYHPDWVPNFQAGSKAAELPTPSSAYTMRITCSPKVPRSHVVLSFSSTLLTFPAIFSFSFPLNTISHLVSDLSQTWTSNIDLFLWFFLSRPDTNYNYNKQWNNNTQHTSHTNHFPSPNHLFFAVFVFFNTIFSRLVLTTIRFSLEIHISYTKKFR